MKAFLKPGQLIVNVAKGIEEHTMLTLSEIIEEEPSRSGGGSDVRSQPCGGGRHRPPDEYRCQRS